MLLPDLGKKAVVKKGTWQSRWEKEVLAALLAFLALARRDTVRALVEAKKEARLAGMIGGHTHTLEMFIKPHHAHTIPPRLS